jgi:hypothetical protein
MARVPEAIVGLSAIFQPSRKPLLIVRQHGSCSGANCWNFGNLQAVPKTILDCSSISAVVRENQFWSFGHSIIRKTDLVKTIEERHSYVMSVGNTFIYL